MPWEWSQPPWRLCSGLLIASAKGFYDTSNTEMTQLATDVVLVDRILAHYGPDAQEVRADATRVSSPPGGGLRERHGTDAKTRFDPSIQEQDALYDKLQSLVPANDSQRHLQAQALGIAI